MKTLTTQLSRNFLLLSALVMSLATLAGATSTNYDHAVTNDDGSVTLVGPQFEYLNNSLPIARRHSEDADFEGGGICLLFGFMEFRLAELEAAPVPGKLYPSIDPFGEFAGNVHALHVYRSITCRK